MTLVTAGIDVGGTKTRAVTLDESGSVCTDRLLPSTSELDSLLHMLTELVVEMVDEGAVAAGVGVAGMVSHGGTVVYSPNLPGLTRAAVGAALSEQVDVPVTVDNDANMAALAEATIGAATDASHMLLVTFGTGIGGAWVVDGKVMRGAHGFFGELGHFSATDRGPRCACGADGHWESYASGAALGRMARASVQTGAGRAIAEHAAGEPITGVHVAAAANQGDSEAILLLEHYANHVAVGLAGLCNIFDPDVVVVGGGVVDLGTRFVEPLRHSVRSHLEGVELRPDVPIRPAALGARANAVGAALAARDVTGFAS